MRHLLRRDKGNALIFGALSFAVLAAFGVLTIDVGRILVTRNQLQNGADAAALAGAAVYCQNPNATDDEAIAQAQSVGNSNKALGVDSNNPIAFPPSTVTVSLINPDIPAAGHRVDVHTQTTTAQYFLGILNVAQKVGTAGAKTADVHADAAAQCGATCGVKCVKPWSPPDRWDDSTPIPGYDGTNKNLPNWRNNNHYDQEAFTDVNGDGIWEKGEPFTDGNKNGKHDEEFYSPTLTGYIPDPIPGNTLAPNGDLGRELTLEFENGGSQTPIPGNYFPIDLPPINRGTPITGGSEFRDNIANCNQSEIWPGDWLQVEPGAMVGPTNQGMRDLIAQDPGAYWDDITQSVLGSAFQISPRIVLIPMYDPRTMPKSGRNTVEVVKVAAFFMDHMVGNSQVIGRFLKVRAPGEPCVTAGGGAGGGGVSFTYSLSLIR